MLNRMTMKTRRGVLGLIAPIVFFAGCDGITQIDNRESPSSTLTGRVVHQGQPVGVRSNGVQLELWQPAYQERFGQLVKIPVHVDQDGTFSAMVFDGTYKLNLLRNNGPWMNSSDTTVVEVNGSATVDVPVTPYYTILNPTFTRGAPTPDNPGGTVSATFKVGKNVATPLVQFVGLYVGTTSFVDRNNRITSITPAQGERARTAIQPQLNTNGDITITVNLPATIYQTNSPAKREFVFVRVGVKTTAVAEMLFSPVVELAI